MDRSYKPSEREILRGREDASRFLSGMSRTGDGTPSAHYTGRTQGSLPMDLTGPMGRDLPDASTPRDQLSFERRLNRSLDRCIAEFDSNRREMDARERGRLRARAEFLLESPPTQAPSPFSIDTPGAEDMFGTLGHHTTQGQATPSSSSPRVGREAGVTSRRYRDGGVTPALSYGYNVSNRPIPSHTVDPASRDSRLDATAQGPGKPVL